MPKPDPATPEARRRVRRLAATWGTLALGSIVTLVVLIVWHLIRRGRLIRQGLGPPRVVRLPDLGADDPAPDARAPS
jgi:hypothetical protein